MVYSIAFYVIFVKNIFIIFLFFVNMHINRKQKMFCEKSFCVDIYFRRMYNKSNEAFSVRRESINSKG